MATTDDWTAGRLVELSEDESWELLAGRPVGRLAWSGPQGISVIPVNYVSRDRQVALQTHAYSAMAREVDGNPIAFQVDELDESTRCGWSVLIRGTAHAVHEPRRDSDSRPDVWAQGAKTFRISLAIASVTGRRVLPG